VNIIRLTAKWLLIVFVIVSTLLAVRRCNQHSDYQDVALNFEKLEPLEDGQIQLVLFHNKKRCYQCLEMEELVQEVLQDHFTNEIQEGALIFNTLVIDEPVNRPLVEYFEVYGATLTIMGFKQGQLADALVLERGPELYRDEQLFKIYLQQELSAKLILENE